MDYLSYLEQMKNIEKNILEFIDKENSNEEDFSKLSTLLSDQSNKHRVKEIIRLIINISNEHHRTNNFFNKIEQILLLFTNTIQQNFSQHEIFNIFVKSKRLLLFIFDHKLIIPDTYVMERFFSNCISIDNPQYIFEYYPQYFYPEIKDFYDKLMAKEDKISLSADCDGIYPGSLEFLGYLTFSESFQFFKDSFLDYFIQYADSQIRSNLTISDDFLRNRKTEDQLNEFITYINQENIPIDFEIEPSLFETNRFVSKSYQDFSLIEYSAFCGSINIFKYLLTNQAELTDSIWLYAIHGKNSEIIHLIEEQDIETKDDTFEKCYYEAIKCFHYEIADYIKNNYISKQNNEKYFELIIKNSNYSLFTDDLYKKKELFTSFCQYDYFEIAQNLVDNYDADINSTFVEEGNHAKDKKAAIHDAIENSKIDLLKFLLSKSNLDLNSKRTQSLLISGVRHQEVRMINVTTPLTMAILNRNKEIIDLLLEQKDKIDVNLKTSFQIIWNKKNYFSYDEPPLIIAIDNKDVDTINLLLSNEKTDVNLNMNVSDPNEIKHNNLKTKIYSPLNLVLIKNDNKITNIFLNNTKVKINDSLLETAAFEQDNLETFKILYKIISKRSVFETQKVLVKAIQSWNSRILKVMLDDQNINVNVKIDEDIQYERRKVNIQDKKLTQNYEFLLHIAVSKGDIEIIELLLKHENLNVNCLSLIQKVMEPVYLKKPLRQIIKIETQKKMPLFMAVESNNAKIVQLLISCKNIDLNAESEFTKEDINYHSLHGDDGGGWVKDKNDVKTEHKTALQMAEENGNQEIISILELH